MKKPLWILALTLLTMVFLARHQSHPDPATADPHPFTKVQAGEPVHHIAP